MNAPRLWRLYLALLCATVSDYARRAAVKIADPVLTTPAVCRTPGGRVVDEEVMRRALEYIENNKKYA